MKNIGLVLLALTLVPQNLPAQPVKGMGESFWDKYFEIIWPDNAYFGGILYSATAIYGPVLDSKEWPALPDLRDVSDFIRAPALIYGASAPAGEITLWTGWWQVKDNPLRYEPLGRVRDEVDNILHFSVDVPANSNQQTFQISLPEGKEVQELMWLEVGIPIPVRCATVTVDGFISIYQPYCWFTTDMKAKGTLRLRDTR